MAVQLLKELRRRRQRSSQKIDAALPGGMLVFLRESKSPMTTSLTEKRVPEAAKGIISTLISKKYLIPNHEHNFLVLMRHILPENSAMRRMYQALCGRLPSAPHLLRSSRGVLLQIKLKADDQEREMMSAKPSPTSPHRVESSQVKSSRLL